MLLHLVTVVVECRHSHRQIAHILDRNYQIHVTTRNNICKICRICCICQIWQYDNMTYMRKNMNPPPLVWRICKIIWTPPHFIWHDMQNMNPPLIYMYKNKKYNFLWKIWNLKLGIPAEGTPGFRFFQYIKYVKYVKYVQYVKYVHLGCAWPVGAQPLLWTCWPAAQPWYWFCSHCATKHKLCSGVRDCVCADHVRRMWETSSDNLCILV